MEEISFHDDVTSLLPRGGGGGGREETEQLADDTRLPSRVANLKAKTPNSREEAVPQ